MSTSILLLISLLSVNVHADSWLCTEESSQRSGNIINACGIGLGSEENTARLKALDNAKLEFKRLCEVSSDCAGRMISVQPQRTTCETEGAGYKCYRLLAFTIGNTSNDSRRVGRHPSSTNENAEFEPFIYGQTAQAHFPKVYVGQSKSDFLELFGKPDRLIKGVNNRDWLTGMYYNHADFCVNGGGCSVDIDTDVNLLGALLQIGTLSLINYVIDLHGSSVYGYSGFKLDYTEELK